MTLESIGQIEKGKSYSSTVYYVNCGIKLDNGEIANYTITRSKLRDIKDKINNLKIGCTVTGLEYTGEYWLTTPHCSL